MTSAPAVGIDLGTTFSAVAIVGNDRQARPLLNAEGTPTTPSVAIWHNGSFLVGQPAIDFVHSAQGSERERLDAALIRGVKRMMGNSPAGGLTSNGYRTTPIEVSAAILAKLARNASARLGFAVQDAVITVPAHFGDRERSATKAAAEMVGLRVLQMINEPSAAALTYTNAQKAEPGVALVFDLGGGTFDATVLQLGEKEARVLATQGIEELGGINFTNTLATALQQRYKAVTKTFYPEDSLSMGRLVVTAEGAKCRLSDALQTIVQLIPSSGPSVELEVTRTQFEDLIDLFVFQLQTAVEMALERASKTPVEINRVLLCGGSSRIPAVQTMLTNLFGRPPERILDLDLSVALGAAYQAFNYKQAELARQNDGQKVGLQMMPGGLVIDCVSYPVGIAVLDSRGDRLVKLVMLRPGDSLDKWSPPYTVRIAGTTTEFPPLAVFRGEGSELDSNDYLGDIPLTLPANTPPGARATIQMLQDQSGLVQVRLTLEGRELPGSLHREVR
jgi:molecular chaperone DnaK